MEQINLKGLNGRRNEEKKKERRWALGTEDSLLSPKAKDYREQERKEIMGIYEIQKKLMRVRNAKRIVQERVLQRIVNLHSPLIFFLSMKTRSTTTIGCEGVPALLSSWSRRRTSP